MELGLLLLRVVAGSLFIGHGSQKVFGWFGGKGPDGTGEWFESLSLRPGRRMAVMAGAAEMTGGVLLALGLLVPAGAALITTVMLVAIWTVHRPNGPWVDDGGWEYPAVLMTIAFALSAIGPGEWSLNEALALDTAGMAWAIGEFVVALAAASAGIGIGRRTARRTGRQTAPPAGGQADVVGP